MISYGPRAMKIFYCFHGLFLKNWVVLKIKKPLNFFKLACFKNHTFLTNLIHIEGTPKSRHKINTGNEKIHPTYIVGHKTTQVPGHRFVLGIFTKTELTHVKIFIFTKTSLLLWSKPYHIAQSRASLLGRRPLPPPRTEAIWRRGIFCKS